MEFGQRLKQLMDERGYTNYRLSQELNCAQSSVANWINDGRTPQKQRIKQIAELFHVSEEYLKGETDDRTKKETPVLTDERKPAVNDQLMALAQKAVLQKMFDQLTEDEQYDVIFQVLAKKLALKELENQKRSE